MLIYFVSTDEMTTRFTGQHKDKRRITYKAYLNADLTFGVKNKVTMLFDTLEETQRKESEGDEGTSQER